MTEAEFIAHNNHTKYLDGLRIKVDQLKIKIENAEETYAKITENLKATMEVTHKKEKE